MALERLKDTCESCRFLKSASAVMVPSGHTCARYPPSAQIVVSNGRVANATSWPVVQLNDGCGEHRAAIQQG
jgi:hypothetical protein